MENALLPHYENPPVIETVLGVQFDPLPGFRYAHLGAFWKSLDAAQWPTVLDASPLQPQFENFAESFQWARGVQFQIMQEVTIREQIKSKKADRMIQLQNARFHFNWLGEGGGKYPRYHTVRDGFVLAWRSFVSFVAKENLGEIRPNQWEVTYLNHIPKGTVWNGPDDWGFFRPLGAVPTIEGVVQGESFGGEWHFVIPNQRGRLHIAWQHAKVEPTKNEIIILNLTARGPLGLSGRPVEEVILEGIDLGREAIVRSFKEMMTSEANKYWGLKHAKD